MFIDAGTGFDSKSELRSTVARPLRIVSPRTRVAGGMADSTDAARSVNEGPAIARETAKRPMPGTSGSVRLTSNSWPPLVNHTSKVKGGPGLGAGDADGEPVEVGPVDGVGLVDGFPVGVDPGAKPSEDGPPVPQATASTAKSVDPISVTTMRFMSCLLAMDRCVDRRCWLKRRSLPPVTVRSPVARSGGGR